MQRLEWKTDLLAEIETRMTQDAVDVPLDPNFTTDNYLKVSFEGVFTGSSAHVLTSERNTGPGYKVVATAAAPNRRIMIDLGFVPLERKPDFEFMTGSVKVTGNLYWPNETDPKYTPFPDFEKNIFFARDLDLMPEYIDAERVLIVATKVEPDLGTTPQRVAHNLPKQSSPICNNLVLACGGLGRHDYLCYDPPAARYGLNWEREDALYFDTRHGADPDI